MFSYLAAGPGGTVNGKAEADWLPGSWSRPLNHLSVADTAGMLRTQQPGRQWGRGEDHTGVPQREGCDQQEPGWKVNRRTAVPVGEQLPKWPFASLILCFFVFEMSDGTLLSFLELRL